jgi:hypothetical protein
MRREERERRVTKAREGRWNSRVTVEELLEEGSISQGNALPGEADEPEIAGLPRIVFRFNNGSHGRLRQLIDRLNGSAGDPH